jgi:DNA sulfur modification protein DndD
LNVQTFELQLFDNDGLAFHHDRMSAGEQQLLAVSFLWALASASGRNLPVVIDTPLGRMDHEHRASLVSRYFPMVSHQVVLLSTDAEIDQHYHQVLVKQRCLEREYTLQFDDNTRCTHIVEGYFRSRDE